MPTLREKLKRGNAEFQKTAGEIPEIQDPKIGVLSCADSRFPIEQFFQVGPNEMFTTRVAGNVVTSEVADSLKYILPHLKCIIVAGHEGCGAVKAKGQHEASHKNEKHPLSFVNYVIEPTPETIHAFNSGSQSLNKLLTRESVRNVYYQIHQLFKHAPEIKTRVQDGTLEIWPVLLMLNKDVQFLPITPIHELALNKTDIQTITAPLIDWLGQEGKTA